MDRAMPSQVMLSSCTQVVLMKSGTSRIQRATLNKSLLTCPEATVTIIQGDALKLLIPSVTPCCLRSLSPPVCGCCSQIK